MSRLVEYLAEIARMLGSESEVHFAGLEAGSTDALVDVEREAAPKVQARIQVAPTPDAPADVAKAYRAIDRMLENDNAFGELIEEDQHRKVITFPGRKKPKRLAYGPFREDTSIDGLLIRIGGLEDLVPVHLKETEDTIHQCQANHQVARDLAPYLFGAPLRAFGNGTWFRDRDGHWQMKRFTIDRFTVLRKDELRSTVERLRSISNNLRNIEDPLAELEELRKG